MSSTNRERGLKQFLRLAACAILLGLVFILLSLLLEGAYKPTHQPALLALNFLSHIGIALLILGIVGIMIDLPDWQKYFQERIKETIVEKEYLYGLSPVELLDLMANALKAYFQVDDLDEKESFLEYFQSRILKFIASPYREDTLGIVHLEYLDDDLFIVNDHTSYRCRKVGKYIQSEASWSVEPGEIVGELDYFQMELRIPENFFQSPDFSTKYPEMTDGKIVIDKDDEKLSRVGEGYKLSLEAYKEVDGLSVSVNVKYKVRRDAFLNWFMIYPSKGLIFNLHYPKELELRRFVFGLNRETMEETPLLGLYTVRSDSWLLPNDGVSYQLLKKV